MISKKDNKGPLGALQKILGFLYQDNLIYGIVLGLIAPLIGLIRYFRRLTVYETYQWLRMNPAEITGLITFCLLANAAFIVLFINGRRDKTSIGIFIVTLLFAVTMMTMKLS